MKTALKAAEIAGEEAEARKEDKISAIARVEKLEKENQQLVERVMEMKMKEAEKMNEISELYEDLQRQKKASELKSIANEMNATASASMRGLSLDSSTSPGFGDSFVGSIPSRQQFRSQTHEGATHRVSCVRSGEILGTCGDDKRVALVNANSGHVSSYLEGALGSLLDLSFSPDDNFCLACGTDKAIQLWELSSGRVRHRMTGHAQKVVGVDFCRVNKQRAISCSHDRTIREWDLHKGICVNSTPCAKRKHSCVWGHFPIRHEWAFRWRSENLGLTNGRWSTYERKKRCSRATSNLDTTVTERTRNFDMRARQRDPNIRLQNARGFCRIFRSEFPRWDELD